MTFTASSSSEKEAWASKLWGLLEETAQKKVFGVDLLELMSRQQVWVSLLFFSSLQMTLPTGTKCFGFWGRSSGVRDTKGDVRLFTLYLHKRNSSSFRFDP